MMLRRLIRFVLVAGVLALLVLTVLHRAHYRSMLAEEDPAGEAATVEATAAAADSLSHFAD